METIHIPLDGEHAHGVYGEYHVVVVFAVGGAEQGGPYSGDGLNFIVAGINVLYNLIPVQPVEMGVGV